MKKIPKGFKKLDIADYLKTEDEIAGFLKLAIEEGDAQLMAHALGIAARARNMSQVAKDAGMTRAGLYKALSASGNPSLDSFMRIIKALGLKLQVA